MQKLLLCSGHTVGAPAVQVLGEEAEALARAGALADLVAAVVRGVEAAAGPTAVHEAAGLHTRRQDHGRDPTLPADIRPGHAPGLADGPAFGLPQAPRVHRPGRAPSPQQG